MARKNRQANRAAGREPTPEQKEQDEFISELAEEDFNPDLDEPDEEEGEGGEEEVTELEETEKKDEKREEEVSKETEPNVKKTEEEGKKEAGKQEEVTSLGDEGEEGEEGDQTGLAKTPEELAEEARLAEEAKKKPEPTAEELEAKKLEEQEAERAAAEEAAKAKPLSDEEAAKVFTEWRQTTEDLLSQHHYALTQEQIEEFEENPAVLIPKLMSRVYMDSISAAFNQFTNYLPRMVGMVIEQRESMNEAEKAFFSKWPDLITHRDAVLRLGQAYRSANPQASMEDFINEVGAQTMVALRLNPANGNGQVQQKEQAKTRAFKPAVETPSGGAPKKKEGNVFEQLSDDFAAFEEELDLD